jgi:hypothetical protein
MRALQALTPNLMDVDELVEQFLQERSQGLATLHRVYFHHDNQLSLRAFKEEIKEELRTGCVCFLNNSSPIDELNDYLFYIANAYCKKLANPKARSKSEYICPGCVFLGKEYSALPSSKILQCDECRSGINDVDPTKARFFRTFYQHSKTGYRCSDCQRFIPHPLDNTPTVSCPYLDCLFAGQLSALRKMRHPTAQSNPEKLILDATQDGLCLKDAIISDDAGAQSQLEITEDLLHKTQLLKGIIETQSNSVIYSGSNATTKHKQLVYQAMSNLLDRYPSEMSQYLLGNADGNMGFQHKIFQEYVKLLEASLPFVITKNKRPYRIDSLLDNNLCLFDGISIFDGIVNDRMTIKNGTQEFYIGGRKAAYTKPYYIGKLLNIVQRDTGVSLLSYVREYSFSVIRMQDVRVGTPVSVSHLRVPPHYQMGGMAYVNRIRKKIVERARTLSS